MTTVTQFKLGFAIIGLVVFAWGVRVDQPRLRVIGIAFVAIAWVLRFVKTPAEERQRHGASDTES